LRPAVISARLTVQEAQHLLGQLFGAAGTALGRKAAPGPASRAAEVDAGGLFLVLAISSLGSKSWEHL